MNKDAREARNKYSREWRKKNPDKVKSYREKYWTRKAAKQKKKPQGEAVSAGGSAADG